MHIILCTYQNHPALTNIKRRKKPSGSPRNTEAPPKTEDNATMRRQQGWTYKTMRQKKGAKRERPCQAKQQIMSK